MNFIDLHTDTPLKILKGEKIVADFTKSKFDGYLQNMAVWINDDDTNPKLTYEKTVYALKSYLKTNKISAFNGREYCENGVILSVENASFLAENPEYLKRFVKDKISIISLSWNGDNSLAGGAYGKGEITECGKEIIQKANSYGLAVDISHLNDISAKQAIEISDFPLATHSNCMAVCSHPRNLSDDCILQLKEKKGIIGLCFYPVFLGNGDVFERIFENIAHLLHLGMDENIAFGSDFDGAEMNEKLKTNDDVSFLFEFLREKGLDESLLNRIFYKNTLAFFDRMCNNIKR